MIVNYNNDNNPYSYLSCGVSEEINNGAVVIRNIANYYSSAINKLPRAMRNVLFLFSFDRSRFAFPGSTGFVQTGPSDFGAGSNESGTSSSRLQPVRRD